MCVLYAVALLFVADLNEQIDGSNHSVYHHIILLRDKYWKQTQLNSLLLLLDYN